MTSSGQPLTRQDFEDRHWGDAIAHSGDREVLAYAAKFAEMAQKAEAEGDSVGTEIFSLLAILAGLHFELDTPLAPFGPDAVVQDLGADYLDVLADLAPLIEDADMRARVADVIWVRRHDHQQAQRAVDAYLGSAAILEDPVQWVSCAQRYERALQLAALFNNKQAAYKNVITQIEATLIRLDGNDPMFLSYALMKLLLGRHEGEASAYAPLSENAARRAESIGSWHVAQAYWAIMAEWFEQAHDQAAEQSAWVNLAECYVKESDAALVGPNHSYMVAKAHLMRAIEVYRNHVGKASAQSRIEELHKLLISYGHQVTGEMTLVSAHEDITMLVEHARQQVEGRPLQDALRALALLGHPEMPQSVSALEQRVVSLAQQFPLQHLLIHQLLSSDGRQIAQLPPILSSDPQEQKVAVRERMFGQAVEGQSLHVEAQIEPARQQIMLEHNPRLSDFAPLVSSNPFIPSSRELIFARGLHAGLIGDWLVAAHLLVPQIENSIRVQLQRHGKITSNLTSKGIQEEYTLSKLFKQHYEGIVAIFGEDLAFDLRGLLDEEAGSNFRNELSHGLLSNSMLTGRASRYLWWLTLHICFRFLMTLQAISTPETS